MKKSRISTKAVSLLLSILMLVTMVPAFTIGSSAENTALKNGDVITLGSYPQSEVTDETVLATLSAKSKTWVSYGYFESMNTAGNYMQYCDIDLDNDGSYDYRGVKFSSYRPIHTTYYLEDGDEGIETSHQYDNGYCTGTEYYFAYEPLTWKVLDAETGLILCEKIIDAQAYSDYYYYGYSDEKYTHRVNDWTASSIRSWLNNTFYNAAFSDSDKDLIELSTISNTGLEDVYSFEDTQDNIFLLSYDDSLNSGYGFSTSYYGDASRKAMGSDYAKCQGLFVDSTDNAGYSCWYLRSASKDSISACEADAEGRVDDSVCENADGIRPALYIDAQHMNYNSTVEAIGNGESFEFGSYPQTKVTDADTLSTLAGVEKT